MPELTTDKIKCEPFRATISSERCWWNRQSGKYGDTCRNCKRANMPKPEMVKCVPTSKKTPLIFISKPKPESKKEEKLIMPENQHVKKCRTCGYKIAIKDDQCSACYRKEKGVTITSVRSKAKEESIKKILPNGEMVGLLFIDEEKSMLDTLRQNAKVNYRTLEGEIMYRLKMSVCDELPKENSRKFEVEP